MKRLNILSLTMLLVAGIWLQSCENTPSPEPVYGQTITVVESGASNPTVAIDAASKTYVAWVGETSEEQYDVYLQILDETGKPLQNPVRVNDIPGDAAPHIMAPAKVAVNASGDVFVVWQNNTAIEGRRFPASDLRFARSTDGGMRFEPAIYVNDDAGKTPAGHTFQDMTVSPDGIIYVSWIDSRKKAMAKRGNSSSGHGGDGPKSEIRVARSVDNGVSFEPSVVVDTIACPCCKTNIICAGNGDIFVAWRREYPGNIRDIVIAKSTDKGLSFSDPVLVNADNWQIDGCPHNGPSVAIADDGAIFVSWFTGKEIQPGSYLAVSRDGGESFGTSSQIFVSENVSAYRSVIGTGAPEQLLIATETPFDGENKIHFAVHNVRTGAKNDRVSGTLLSPGTLPAMALTGSRLAIAWQDGQSVRVNISKLNKLY